MIITEKEYQQALARMRELFHVEPGDPNEAEFDGLCSLVVAYEMENYKINEPDREEAIKFRKEQEE